MGISNRCAPACGNVDCKNNHGWGFPSDHSFGSKITRLAHFRFRTLNNADVLLDSGLKLSDIIVTLCSKLLDYMLLKSGSKY